MAEITNELVCDMLKQLQGRMGSFEKKMDEVKREFRALRIRSIAAQPVIQNVYATLVPDDGRLTRVAQRLKIAKVSG